jgi:hypothetical protein
MDTAERTRMDTARTTTDPRLEEIAAIVQRLAEVQRSRKLSDRQLVEEYPDLGSTKTWRQRLVPGTLDGLNLDRLAGKLRRLA